MTNKARAINLGYDIALAMHRSESITPLILTHDDEIRRECADKADVWAIKELAIKEQRQRLRAAIMGRSEG